MIVYKVTSPSNKVYIGITGHTLEIRKSGHNRAVSWGSKTKFHKAIRKYGDLLVWEIVHICETWKEAQEVEIKLINYYNSFVKGYNSTLGGDGQLGNAPMLGKKHSKETINKMSKIKLGKAKPKGMAEKMSKLHKGRIQSKTHINNCLESRNLKPFLMFKIDGTFIGEFINQSECARLFNLNQCLISGCLTTPNKNKSHKGYIFKYKD